MARRRATIYINGKEISNNIKAIYKEKRALTRELDQMTIGTKAYKNQMKKLNEVNGIIDQHKQGLRGLNSTWSKLGKGAIAFTGVAAVAFGVNELVSYGAELFTLGTEMETLGKKAQTVLGEELDAVTKKAEKNAHAMGLTKGEYIDATTAIADLLIPMKFTRKEAGDISTTLVDLSGALSEWTGGQKSAEEVAKVLGKAVLGEREELKGLGISIQEADVTARLAQKGLKNLTGEMLQQAKAAVTLELITEKSIDAQTAYANNSDSLVRKQAAMSAQFNEIKETMATALIPVFHRLLEVAHPIIVAFSEWITQLSSSKKATNNFTTHILNIVKVVQILYGAIGKLIGWIRQNWGKEIDAATDALIRWYNYTVDLINSASSYIGLDVKLGKLDTGEFDKSLEKKKDEIAKEKVVIPVRTQLPQIDEGRLQNAEDDGRNKKSAEARAKKEERDLQSHLKRLQQIISKNKEELTIAELEEEAQKEARIKSKFDKDIQAATTRLQTLKNQKTNEAQQLTDLILTLEQQRDQALEVYRQEKQKKEKEEKKLIDQQIKEELATEQEAELLRLESHYQMLLNAAAAHEIDITLLKEQYESERSKIKEKYNKKEIESSTQIFIAQRDLELKRIDSLQQGADALGQLFKGNEGLMKTLFTFQKALAASEVIINLQKQNALIDLKYAAIPGGLALAATEKTFARINAATRIATIAATVVQKYTQKKKGGWSQVVGADDNKTYTAQYIGQPVTGMLPDHPVLVDTSAGKTIASEVGREYFVSNSALRHPQVLNYVNAIDNIVKYQRMQNGGFTSNTSAPTLPTDTGRNIDQSDNTALLHEIRRLNDVLESGIIALIDDDTIIELYKRYQQLLKNAGGSFD